MDELLKRQIARDKRHRNREFALAGLLILFVFIGTWGQTSYFGSDSWFFLVLLNFNAILMLIVFYLVARNVVKLFTERRRKVFGSRLRTRLLLAFGSLALIPILLMFLAANRVVITSIDYWFTSTVASSMEAALDVGQSIYDTSTERLGKRIEYINNEINSRITTQKTENNSNALSLTEKSIKNQGIIHQYIQEIQALLTGNTFAYIQYNNDQARLDFALPQSRETSILVQRILQHIDWKNLISGVNTSPYTNLVSIENKDFAFAIQALFPGSKDFIIIAENIGNTAQSNLQSIRAGFDEYIYLKSLKRPLKLSFSLILGLLGLIMIFTSIFMAFRLSKELTAPIEALAKGTDRLAHGELDIMLEDSGKDELGQLVESFNSMITQVRLKNEDIRATNFLLEQRNIFISNVLENIATGVFVLTPEGTILTINKAACSMFNIQAELLINQNPYHYFPAKEQENFLEMINFLSKNKEKRWRKEIELQGKYSLKLRVTALMLPVSFNEENPTQKEAKEGLEYTIIVVLEDITELAHIERLAAWREVAKRIAHEMKNPLTPIRLSAERLQKRFNSQQADPIFSECTGLIINEVERIQEMIKDFTTFAQMPEVHLEENNIVALVDESLKIFKASHTNINWILEVESYDSISKLPPLLIHEKTFKQALMNIYLNASDALTGVENAKVLTKINYQENECHLIIADNGTGLTEDALKHLFDPYFSKKKHGTGLGLSIAKSIIEEHHAHIHAKNNEMGGTSFIITIPTSYEYHTI